MTDTIPTSEENQAPHWHPKITIYRALVLSTTIGLGSAKAISAENNKIYVSTTIEWIAGVIVFLALFFIGSLESKSSDYPSLWWLLDYDLLDLLWKLTRLVSLSPPRYTSDEYQFYPNTSLHSVRIPITGYRLLNTLVVILFGLIKAFLAYVGQNTAANAVDWTSAVVLGCGLYCLGLYENNPSSKMPYFFEENWNDTVYSGSIFFSKIMWYIAMMMSSTLLMWVLQDAWKMISGPPVDFLFIYDGTHSEGPPTFWRNVHDWSSKLFIASLVGPAVPASAGLLLYYLWKLLSTLYTPVLRRVTKPLRLAILKATDRILGLTYDQSFDVPLWVRSSIHKSVKICRFIGRFGPHFLLHMYAIIACLAVVLFFGGSPLRIFHKTESKTEDMANLFAGILFVFISSFMVAAACGGIFLSVCSLIKPFLQDWNSSTYQPSPLELFV